MAAVASAQQSQLGRIAGYSTEYIWRGGNKQARHLPPLYFFLKKSKLIHGRKCITYYHEGILEHILWRHLWFTTKTHNSRVTFKIIRQWIKSNKILRTSPWLKNFLGASMRVQRAKYLFQNKVIGAGTVLSILTSIILQVRRSHKKSVKFIFVPRPSCVRFLL
jgi:hypothetical protein